jgi:plastocyanin
MKRRLRTGGSLMVLMVALALATAACSSGSSSSSGSSGGSTTPPPSPTATQGGGSSGGGGGGGVKSATVQAGAGGFVFAPSTVSIAKGGTITVQNAGTIPHTFTIQDKGINEVLNAGQSAKVKVDLAPGTYPFVCTFHQSSGMTGTLTVT